MKILLVDPSRVILKVTSGYLSDTGYDILCFANAAEAFEILRTDPAVEVLVTSHEPHGMTGLALCRAARALAGARRALHIIVMSSSSEGRSLVEALDAGADDFMGRPPAHEEFLARLRVARRVGCLQKDLIALATIDGLTNLPNRRAFFEAAQALNDAARPTASVAIFDIDHFKLVNDVHGHATGDQVLKGVTVAAASSPHFVGRLGGEEFGVLFDNLDLDAAEGECELLRKRIEALSFPEMASDFRVTCSFGVAERRADERIEDALLRADVALYAAKTGGRNRVTRARDDGPPHELPPAASHTRQSSRLPA